MCLLIVNRIVDGRIRSTGFQGSDISAKPVVKPISLTSLSPSMWIGGNMDKSCGTRCNAL